MKRKVYTYRSISALNDHPCFNELMNAPHITATADLYSAMRDKWPEIKHLVDIHNLQKGIISNWEDPGVAFQQFLNISKVIRLLPANEEERILHQSFIKNKVPVLNAIRLLTEASVSPDDIVPRNLEETLFKRIWKQLDLEDSSFCDLRVTLASFIDDKTEFESILRAIAPCLTSDTIVLHGFYFITPIQEQIFDMLENCGKQLIFLCCIDDTVPEVGEIWTKVLSQTNNFEPVEQWVTAPNRQMLNRAFGSVFGTEPQFPAQEHISIMKYDSELDFVRDVDRLLKDGIQLFSTDIKSTDELLKEFYPAVYQRRHLLAYPVGQYIYRLHSMWSTKDQCLTMTIDDIQSCFASGWVVKNGVNAIAHMHGLEYLATYVSDCRTFPDWEKRLALLQETKHTVLAAFETHINEMPAENRRWHKIMADPFLNFSCFRYDDEKLQELIDLIRHLITTARSLFTGPGEISVTSHLSRLKRLLVAGKGEEELIEEERAIIEALITRLRQPKLDIDKCLPGEISQAIILLVGGGILDEDNYSVQSGHDHTFVKPLYQIESAPVLCEGRVHLCFADETRLPGSSKPYVWPLNNDFLDRLIVPREERRHQYLQDMRDVIDNAPLANRYLFYSLLQNEKVEVSWIAAENDKEIAASPYVQILRDLFHVPLSHTEKHIWTEKDVAPIVKANNDLAFDAGFESESPLETKLDAALCPRRYLYSYSLSELPSFSSDFHYNFALSNLIGVISKIAGVSKKEASDEVLDLFPYLRPIERQQIMDHIPHITDDGTDALDGVSYPSARAMVHFLHKRISQKAGMLLEERIQDSVSHIELAHIDDLDSCKYCPYSNVCPRAVHNG